ncbi:MAG: sigma-54-dependent Fis family transcriptional regulator [Candidatus Zixiibacteriota bacterium]|nr:MAG: sigma-54-dependent Fis family transcriptional regulator [candidate division Zixibacteria bacterium]
MNMTEEKTKLLIIDDDPKVSWILREGLEDEFDILTASDGVEGIQVASKEKPPLILLDIRMPGMNGMEVLKKIKKSDLLSDVIMLSGQGETQTVVDCIKLGATEFINKPFDVKEVGLHLQNALRRRQLEKEVRDLKVELQSKSQYESFVGDSLKMQEIKNLVEQVADSELSVLIRGESGTGKEIVARMLHSMSPRRANPFIKVNCAAIPRELLEAELFGYEKGAFTGAHKTKPGRFETANKGTIFLDEIGDMSVELQAKLLQVLEQHEFIRVGGITNIKVDVRIVCATNRDLERAIFDGGFRDDLFYRLNEITVQLPPLRERTEDIPLLVNHFLQKYNALYKRDIGKISPECMTAMVRHHWPGNVRQLENLIKQIVVRQDESVIFDMIQIVGDMPTASSPTTRVAMAHNQPIPAAATHALADTDVAIADSYSLKQRLAKTIEDEEKKLISEVLKRTNWNRRRAAEMLEISYRSLLYKIKEYRLNDIK